MAASSNTSKPVTTVRRSFCRICHAACPVDVDIVDGRPVRVRGVDEDPIFKGYTCVKGRQLPDQINDPARLRAALKRTDGGTLEEVASGDALDEVAARLQAIIEEHGGRAVASYTGTGGYQNAPSHPVAQAFHRAIDSISYYTSVTIDQPMKATANMRLGIWEAGPQNFTEADVLLAIGYNPMVSSFAPFGGLQGTDPFATLRARKAEGMKLVVVDPRRTELASQADIHLQVKPGEDPTLLAGMLRRHPRPRIATTPSSAPRGWSPATSTSSVSRSSGSPPTTWPPAAGSTPTTSWLLPACSPTVPPARPAPGPARRCRPTRA